MSVSVEPRPAELPLPGGRERATVRLHPLLTGQMSATVGFVERPRGPFATLRGLGLTPGRTERTWLPIPAFLVEHPGAGPILVDAGLHPSVAIDPRQSLGPLLPRLTAVRMEREQAVPAQLRARGVEAAEVSVVVMTHLHFDHAAGVSEFPHATFVLDRREWEAATNARGLMNGYRTAHFDYPFDWRTIDYEAPQIDSFETFGAAVDLFGDGSVRLVATPGHSAGHLSVLLRLSGGEALLTGDAAFTLRGIEDGTMPLLSDDDHRFRRSLGEIRRFMERTPNLLVIPGHDAEAWPKLEPVYG